MGWQPADTAPKGEAVLVFCPDAREPHICVATLNDFVNPDDPMDIVTDWSDEWLEDALDVEPTHWMPLPPAPGEGE